MTTKKAPDGALYKDVEYIREKVDLIESRLERNYVTKDELLLLKQECLAKIESLDVVKKLVYGIVALIVTGVFSALLSLVIIK